MSELSPDDISRDLAELQSHAVGLGGLLGELERAAPARSEGADATGSVRAVLDPAGLPAEIQVADAWRDRLRPEALAAAVGQACQSAARARGAAWQDALQRSGWLQRIGRLGGTPAGDTPAGGAAAAGAAAAVVTRPGELPAAFRRPAPAAARPPAELAEQVMTSLDGVAEAAARPRPPLPRGSGANAERTVTVSLPASGQLTCEINPHWAARRTGTALSAELAAVLATARQSLAAAAAIARPDPARAGQLLHEALAALGELG